LKQDNKQPEFVAMRFAKRRGKSILRPTSVQNATPVQSEQWLNLECADRSALWNDATCRVETSGVQPPQSKVCPVLQASASGLQVYF
jgi:hypothetical protein